MTNNGYAKILYTWIRKCYLFKIQDVKAKFSKLSSCADAGVVNPIFINLTSESQWINANFEWKLIKVHLSIIVLIVFEICFKKYATFLSMRYITFSKNVCQHIFFFQKQLQFRDNIFYLEHFSEWQLSLKTWIYPVASKLWGLTSPGNTMSS